MERNNDLSVMRIIYGKVYTGKYIKAEGDNMKEEIPERCISCGITLTGVGGTRFPCPSCGTVIARCNRCKKQSNVYTCKACGFSGP